MLPRLPDFIDPWACAQGRRSLSGEIPLARLERLAPSLMDQAGAVAVSLDCEMGAKKRPHLRGEIRGTLSLQCQRCLEAVELPLTLRFDLVAVASAAEAEALPEELDAVIAETGRIRTADLVEDELLLALPLIPRHTGPCGAGPDDGAEPDDEPSPLAAALAGLK